MTIFFNTYIYLNRRYKINPIDPSRPTLWNYFIKIHVHVPSCMQVCHSPQESVTIQLSTPWPTYPLPLLNVKSASKHYIHHGKKLHLFEGRPVQTSDTCMLIDTNMLHHFIHHLNTHVNCFDSTKIHNPEPENSTTLQCANMLTHRPSW